MAPGQVQRVRLAKTGVRAGGARGGTVEAVVNTAQQQVAIQADRPGMPLDDVSNRHVVAPSCRNLSDVISAAKLR